MRNKEDVKEAIIDATTKLIQESNGDVDSITARAIAEKSEVALGLINYHFGSKDNLIAVCAQRIINKVLMNFAPDKIDYTKDDGLSDKERLTAFAQQTYDFLFANYAMIKISILSDFKDYQPKSNAAYTQLGFRFALRGDIPERQKQHIAFSLTSILQAAFLTGENSKLLTGYDLTQKPERDRFVSDTVSMLMESAYE